MGCAHELLPGHLGPAPGAPPVTFTYSSVVRAPVSEVFAWHGRPGALERLTPPWQPVRVEGGTPLGDGRGAVRLPLSLRWVVRRSGDEPPVEFTEELVSLPIPWRHVHRFTPEDDTSTRVTDTVDTPVPDRFLRPTFAYRHRQLAEDLEIHRELSGDPSRRLIVGVTGASGLVGSALCALLTTGGHTVVRLVRREPAGPGERRWEPSNPDPRSFEGLDAVVHLAGATIAGRFSGAHKAAIRDSRVGPTRLLARAIADLPEGPRVLVAASAIGFYGPDRGDELLDEASPGGSGFLADVVADWEAATGEAATRGVRVVNVRTGIVQSPRGGTLRLFRPLFLAGLGGPLGTGTQWLSWVDVDDLADVYYRALVDERLSGPVNAVSPSPVSNREYASTLAGVLRRPAVIRVPDLGPRILLGAEGAAQLARASQRVVPARLSEIGHRFRRRALEDSLRHQLGRPLA